MRHLKINPYADDAKRVRVKYLSSRYQNLVTGFPNFHKSGSTKGMKEQVYGRGALLVRCGQFIYNVTGNPKIYHESAIVN